MFGLFGTGDGLDMRRAAAELERDPSIILIDVRTPEEYASGHIPGSINIPLDRAAGITERVKDRDARIFVYCLSGARSRSACQMFTRLGYTGVVNIGGINSYPGLVVKN